MYKNIILNIIVVMSIIFNISSANSDMLEKNFLEMQESERDFLHMLEVEKEKREKKKLVEKKLREEQERIEKEEKLRLVKEKIEKQKVEKEKREAREKYQKEIEIYLAKKEKERVDKVEKEKKKLKKELASKHIYAKIDISKQMMMVYKGGKHIYTWKVSTGKNGYRTPRGDYKPTYITRMHYSKTYYNSPMPYSIFFKGGYAIHGTKSVSRLGSRASHGCVRLLTSNAKKLYKLVRKFGRYNTKIQIVN